MKKTMLVLGLVCSQLQAKEPAHIFTPDDYFQSIQYNWTGERDGAGRKIPGDSAECWVRGIANPTHTHDASIVDFTVLPGHRFNPVTFSTINSLVYITSGEGYFIVYDEQGQEHMYEVTSENTVYIPAKTTYSFASDESELKGIFFSTPAWFQEDEEYDWDLVRFVFPHPASK